MAYFIKMTLIWTILLVLYEVWYKHNTKFTVNRLYLVLSLAIGLLVPAIPSLFSQSWATIPDFPVFRRSTITLPTTTGLFAADVNGTQHTSSSLDRLMFFIGIVYVTGMLILLLKYLSEVFKIQALIRKHPVQLHYGHKVICTGRNHAPYSFMSYTFMPDVTTLPPAELEYIVLHEAAHHNRKHWLDLWILQLLNMVFWFHPLVWRYRYLLQLQHEYEADAIAAGHDPYAYGHFLLRQTFFGGIPSVAHSFYFSPIKNRIYMLTKIKDFKYSNGKYLLLLPAMLGCSFLMAKSAVPVADEIPGNKMSFNGNIITWRLSDTIAYDKEKAQADLVPAGAKVKPQVITGYNNELVYRNDVLQTPATYGHSPTDYAEYVKTEFHKLRKNTSDSLTYLVDLNLVVDKEGRVVYYQAHYARPQQSPGQQQIWNTLYNWDTQANALMDRIIAASPLWTPAYSSGNAVNSFVNVSFPGC